MIAAFIATKGVTKCPAREAQGVGMHSPTAYSSKAPTTSFLFDPGTREEPSGERALAHAKILTHLQELSPALCAPTMANQSQDTKITMREYSLNWFFSASSDFKEWCETAGFHPDDVRKQAQKVYDGGYKRRLEKGERKKMTKEERGKYNLARSRDYRRRTRGLTDTRRSIYDE